MFTWFTLFALENYFTGSVYFMIAMKDPLFAYSPCSLKFESMLIIFLINILYLYICLPCSLGSPCLPKKIILQYQLIGVLYSIHSSVCLFTLFTQIREYAHHLLHKKFFSILLCPIHLVHLVCLRKFY